MLVLDVKLQVIPLAILLWAQLTLESHIDRVIIDTAGLRMSLQMIRPREAFLTRVTLEHCLD